MSPALISASNESGAQNEMSAPVMSSWELVEQVDECRRAEIGVFRGDGLPDASYLARHETERGLVLRVERLHEVFVDGKGGHIAQLAFNRFLQDAAVLARHFQGYVGYGAGGIGRIDEQYRVNLPRCISSCTGGGGRAPMNTMSKPGTLRATASEPFSTTLSSRFPSGPA